VSVVSFQLRTQEVGSVDYQAPVGLENLPLRSPSNFAQISKHEAVIFSNWQLTLRTGN
jgi:hypothetical protein